MARNVYNPKQTRETQMYYFPGNKQHNAHYIGPFKQKDGYAFSDDKEMDSVVDYFVKKMGFKIKGQKTSGVSSQVNKTDDEDKEEKPKKSTGFMSKK